MKCMDYKVAFNSLLCKGFILAVFRYTEPLQYLETKSGAICIQTQLRMSFINITISIAFLSLLEGLINILWGPSCTMNRVREELFGKHWKQWQMTRKLLLVSLTLFKNFFLKQNKTLWQKWCFHIIQLKFLYKSNDFIFLSLRVHILKQIKQQNIVYRINNIFINIDFKNDFDIYLFNTFGEQC